MVTTIRKGNSIRLSCGGKFWPLDPVVEEIHLHDIVHALSKICRWGGHSLFFYTVAQHCVHVSELGKNKLDQKWGLLHDAAETYIGDMVGPLKIHMPKYKAIEEGIMKLIAKKWDLPYPMPASVKHNDEVITATEGRDIMPGDERTLELIDKRAHRNMKIVGMNTQDARAAFMARYKELFGNQE